MKSRYTARVHNWLVMMWELCYVYPMAFSSIVILDASF